MAKKAEKKRSKPAGPRSKSKAEFRGQVQAEVVDQLLHRFVALVKHGLELLLCDPSELARQEFRQHPALVYTGEEIPGLVLWAAVGAYELPWPAFCQHVLTHPQWAALLGVATQADLDRLVAHPERYIIHKKLVLIQLIRSKLNSPPNRPCSTAQWPMVGRNAW